MTWTEVLNLPEWKFNRLVNQKRIEGVIDTSQEVKIRTAYALKRNQEKKEIKEVFN